jgi:Tissue inhibitor of metalloproteinase
MTPLRHALAVLVVGLTLTVVTEAPAHAACTCQRPSVAQQVENADAVFSGTVTMASGPTTSGKRQVMSYDIKVDRVYKGDVNSTTVTVKSNADPTRCGVTGMTAGTRYLFFVRANEEGKLLADRCGGTGPAKSAKTQKVIAILGRGSNPTPPTPDDATFTRVADSDAPALSRLAAPGAAMVLVGLLGLMVFGALGRSRRT